jgi:hypothetical protein
VLNDSHGRSPAAVIDDDDLGREIESRLKLP